MKFSHRILLSNKSIQLALNFLRVRITVKSCTSPQAYNLLRELYLHKKHLKYISTLAFIALGSVFVCIIPFRSRDYIQSGNIGMRKAHEPQKARWKRAACTTTFYGSFLMGKRCLKIKEMVPSGTKAHRLIERE